MKKELPSGWQEKKLNELFNNLNERNHEDKTILASTQDRGVIPNYMLGKDIIRKEDSLSNYKLVKKDCFIISLRSFQGGFEHSNYEGIVSPAYTILEPKINFEPLFYKAYFKSHYFINKSLAKYVEGIRDGKQIRYEECKNIVVPFPPLDEQKRIADILSTFDDLIENLTKLIEKKEIYKKGVMQRVLTGKVRFNGFTDEWEEVYIKDVGTIITGNTPSTKDKSFWGGKHVWVTPTDINKKDIDNSERKLTDIGLSKARKLPKNTLLVTCIASIGKNSILRCEGSCNQQINAIIPNKNFSAEFLYYIFENNKEYLNAKAPASATKIISKTEFEKLSFILPKIEEQNKIAELLTLIDKDIEILKQLLHLRKLQKKGVMQKLLTGEVRV